ncbi:MAG: GAF domain-containing protein [Chloroflexi bacterium]|nr:GAF domain-containing protein [Chloroflexota bacterium]MBT7081044.1 GAF domain-containing protein [Chloroflexota bacterium]MBT7289136.1 GAF domain-containing protein [Chloroflexota bacterium]
MKLQVRVILIVIAIMAIMGIVSGGIVLYFQRSAMTNQFEDMGIALTDVLQSSLEQGMLTGERQVTQDAMIRIGREDVVTSVHLLYLDGTIAASSNPSDIGLTLDYNEVLFTLQSGEISKKAIRHDGENEFIVVTPILNTTECQGCHSADNSILGAIEVGIDSTSLYSQTERLTIYIGILGGCTFLVLGILLAFALKRTMINPLSKLAESALSFTNGNYKARVDVTKKDEIGMLANAFNSMADSVELRTSELESSRKQLADAFNDVLDSAQLHAIDLEDKVQQRTNELSALNKVITTVSKSLNRERILNSAMKKIMAVMEIEAGFVYLLDEKTGRLFTKTPKDLSNEDVKEAIVFAETKRVEPNKSLFKKVIQSKEPIVIGNIAENSEFETVIGEKERVRSSVGVPIKWQNEILGVLFLFSYTPNRFDNDIVPLILAMGDAIGVAINNARTARSLREAKVIRDNLLEKLISAQEDERKRIARELHDEANQSLAALILNLQLITNILPSKYKDIKQQIDAFNNRVIETINVIRTLALELRPSILDDLGLSMAIKWYAKDYLTRRGLNVDIDIAESKSKIPTDIETMLFRILQEALTNIIKHAKASYVVLRLHFVSSVIIMSIEDNGEGFDVQNTLSAEESRQNLGLHGMSERATLLKGKLTINSTLGQGTTIQVEVPLEGEIQGEKY